MSVPLYQIDAFADGPFTGNPAAVCVVDVDDPRADEAAWMQRVAEEMNLSETAFVVRADGGGGEDGTHDAMAWRLRWFTPAAEVELCGHATLASAHVLWETGRVPGDRSIVFHTRFRGALPCRRDGDRIAMDFPAESFDTDVSPPAELLETLGLAAERVAAIARGPYDWLVECRDPGDVTELAPDFAGLRRFDTRGVCVTAWAEGVAIDLPAHANREAESAPLTADVVSRFFAPRLRINEDPVTGSLHALLGPWWRDRRGVEALDAYQASSRGGRLRVVTRGDRVELAGRSVTISRGVLLH